MKKSNTKNRDELGEDCPNQSGGLISGAAGVMGWMKESPGEFQRGIMFIEKLL